MWTPWLVCLFGGEKSNQQWVSEQAHRVFRLSISQPSPTNERGRILKTVGAVN